jgi:hypothetical protein
MALAAALAGCAGLPTGRFEALATSTRDIQTKTVQTDGDIVKLIRRFMVFSPAPGEYKLDSFAPVIEVAGTKQDFDLGPSLEPREAALDTLAAYASALAAFAKKDYQGDLDEATQDLGGSVQRLSGHVLASSEAKTGAGVLATAVNGLGTAVIDHMRREALKKAMDQASPGIGEIARFINEVNGKAALAVRVMRSNILQHANRMKAEGVARLQLNESVEEILVESNAILAHLKQATAAVDAIRPAHDEIRASLDRDDRTALDKLKALVAETKRLQKFYSSLK